jgi:hypothetical protein
MEGRFTFTIEEKEKMLSVADVYLYLPKKTHIREVK